MAASRQHEWTKVWWDDTPRTECKLCGCDWSDRARPCTDPVPLAPPLTAEQLIAEVGEQLSSPNVNPNWSPELSARIAADIARMFAEEEKDDE